MVQKLPFCRIGWGEFAYFENQHSKSKFLVELEHLENIQFGYFPSVQVFCIYYYANLVFSIYYYANFHICSNWWPSLKFPQLYRTLLCILTNLKRVVWMSKSFTRSPVSIGNIINLNLPT